MRRIIARILRLVHGSREGQYLTVDENHAGLLITELAQRRAFKSEIQALSKGQDVPSTSKLHSLNPYIIDGAIDGV